MDYMNKDRFLSIASLILGLVAFLYFCDIRILNPTNYKWLLLGDPSQHYLGWETFRSTPKLQWPIGVNYNYGMETSTSIVFTDSIPLLAIFFKYLSPLLPVNFQYTGLWLLSCFMLQSYFGYKIIRRITCDGRFSLICGFILSFAPTLLFRTQNHYALCAQFLILAAFYLYLTKSENKRWSFLICIAALVHAYLLLMVLAVYATRMLSSAIENKDYKGYALKFITSIMLCLFVMYSCGYFVVHNGVSAGGYGIYRADTMALFNPVYPYLSRFSRVNNNQLTNAEGMGYIGFGLIISLVAIIIYVANKSFTLKELLKANVALPLISILLIYAFSVSNVISIQGIEIFKINLPHKLEGALNTFRAGGRFIWVIAYVVMIVVFASVHSSTTRNAIIIVTLIAAIQLADVSRFRFQFESSISKAESKGMLVSDQHYSVDYNEFKRIIMLSPRDITDKSPIIYLAATHNLPVNSGYMARYDSKKESSQNNRVKEIINKKELDSESIFIIGDSASSLRSLCGKGYTCENGYSGTMIYKTK